MHSIYENLIDWTRQAGALAKEKRNSPLTLHRKTPRDLVTDADLAVDTFIKERILERYPEHKILSEELSPEQSSEALQGSLWIVDPIDGTHNYSRNHYQCAVSIAYAEQGTVLYGAVYNPFVEEFFNAGKDSGAFLNGSSISCSAITDLSKALVGVGRPASDNDIHLFSRDIEAVLLHCWDMRRIGSGALDICWVAAGRLDAFFETLNPWDIAAAVLIAKEAGAVTCAFREQSNSPLPEDLNGEHLFVSTPAIKEPLTTLLRDNRK